MSSLFSFDPIKRAEDLAQKGQFGKAAELLAKRKHPLDAGRMALRGNDPKAAARYFFQATVGSSDDAGELKPLQVGGLLVAAGHLREAVAMFELARAFDRAADVSSKLRDYPRAAINYERSQKYTTAAQYYERANDLENAARLLAAESRKLGDNGSSGSGSRSVDEQRRALDIRRAKLLVRAGKSQQAAEAIRPWPARTSQDAEMVEQLAGPAAAVDAYLSIGMPQAALRLLEQDANADRRQLANVQRRCGQLGAAAATYAALGDDQATAEVLDEAGNHESAAKRWEKAGKLRRAARSHEKAKRWADAGRCYAAAGRYGRASQLYLQANDPLQAAQCLLEKGDQLAAGRMLQKAGRAEQAAQTFRQIGVRDGGYPDATLQLLPYLVDQENDAKEGLRRLNLVSSSLRDPQRSPEWLYWEARCLELLERKAEAVAAYRRLLIARSDFRDAVERLNHLEHQVIVSEVVSGSPTAAIPTGTALADAISTSQKSPTQREAKSKPKAKSKRDDFSTTDFEQLLEESRLHRQRSARTAVDMPGASASHNPKSSLSTGADQEPADRTPEASYPNPTDSLENIKVGTVFADRYEIVKTLGKGGMGQVYRANDLLLEEAVAIKTVLQHAEPEHAERLIREVQICRKIAHPNVVRVHDAGRLADGIFVTMELIRGEPLDVVLRTDKKPALARVRSLLLQIANGLDAAHQLKVVHRDLKPGNVMVSSIAAGKDAQPTEDHVKLVDFGIARMQGVGATITQAGLAVGSPLYMSPEQLSGGHVDARADLYALGNLAYRLLIGYEPFRAEDISAVLYGHLHTPAPPLEQRRSELAGAWSATVAALLAKRPEDRPASARAVAELLEGLPVE